MKIQDTKYFETANADGTPTGVRMGPNANTDAVPVAAGSFNSAGFPIPRVLGYCVALSWPTTGTPVGTLKLQASIDDSINERDTPDEAVATWFDITSASVSLTGAAGTQMFLDPEAFYRWVRVSWTATSGSIALTAKIQFKGIG